MNGKQITPFYSLRQSVSVSHGFSLGLFKGARKICRCSCFCLAKLITVCMQTFRCATPKLEISKKIWFWNLLQYWWKPRCCGRWAVSTWVCAICRTRSVTPAARQSTGGWRPQVSHWVLTACHLQDPENHCTSLPWLPHLRIKKLSYLLWILPPLANNVILCKI